MGKVKSALYLLKNNRAAISSTLFTYFSKTKISRLVPDEIYLKWLYRAFMHEKLNLKNPKKFNEKLQWLKIHNRKPEFVTMVDKYSVRDYVAEKIGDEYLIPLLGVWDKAEDIDFDALPNEFVLKCNHDSGSVVVCRDKAQLDKEAAITKLNKKLKRDMFWWGREWPYKDVERKIICEEFLPSDEKGLVDYKFYCFDGEPKVLYVSQGLEDHSTARISFLTLDWQFAGFKRNDFESFEELPKKPEHFDKMVEIAKELSKGHTFLRVDLYEVNGKIYFSELTFTPGSGLTKLVPEKWDYELGSWIDLQK